MNEIVELMDSLNGAEPGKAQKTTGRKKRLINECNEKVDSYSDEMLELPKNRCDQLEINAGNHGMLLSFHFG